MATHEVTFTEVFGEAELYIKAIIDVDYVEELRVSDAKGSDFEIDSLFIQTGFGTSKKVIAFDEYLECRAFDEMASGNCDLIGAKRMTDRADYLRRAI